jgi:hypothetical protein
MSTQPPNIEAILPCVTQIVVCFNASNLVAPLASTRLDYLFGPDSPTKSAMNSSFVWPLLLVLLYLLHRAGSYFRPPHVLVMVGAGRFLGPCSTLSPNGETFRRTLSAFDALSTVWVEAVRAALVAVVSITRLLGQTNSTNTPVIDSLRNVRSFHNISLGKLQPLVATSPYTHLAVGVASQGCSFTAIELFQRFGSATSNAELGIHIRNSSISHWKSQWLES